MSDSFYKSLKNLFCFLAVAFLLALFFSKEVYPLPIAAIVFLAIGVIMDASKSLCIPILLAPFLLAVIEIARTSGEHLVGPVILMLLSLSLLFIQLPIRKKSALFLSNGASAAAFSLAFIICAANFTQLERVLGVQEFTNSSAVMGFAYLLLSVAAIILAEYRIGNRLLPFQGAPLILSIFIIIGNARVWWVFDSSSRIALSEPLRNLLLTILITCLQLSLLFILSLFFLGKRRQKSSEYESVLNSSDEAIFAIDRRGVIYYVNQSGLRLLGVPPSETKRPISELITGTELNRGLEAKNSLRMNDLIHVHQGEDCFCQVKIEPLSNGDKIILLHDITERIQSEEQLRSLLRDLSRTNKQLTDAKKQEDERAWKSGRFLATLSHEIRNPLSSIISLSQLLETTSLSDEQKHFLELIKKSEHQLLKLINDILDYSKIEEGFLKLQEERFPLRAFLEEIAEGFMPLARQKRLQFTLLLGEALPESVVGDSHRLRQILLNFLGNALKFTSKGSITLSANCLDGDRIRFEVIDTGPGISEEMQERLFTRFSQGGNLEVFKHGGSGLGLSIAKELTEMMHGKVGVSSITDEGTTFYAEIPFKF